MAQLGADVEQLDCLSNRLRDTADRMNDMTTQLSNEVASAWWKGGDADRFRQEWNCQHRAQLRQLMQLLQATSQSVKRQAAQQRQVSQV